jgi:hypothetical protein
VQQGALAPETLSKRCNALPSRQFFARDQLFGSLEQRAVGTALDQPGGRAAERVRGILDAIERTLEVGNPVPSLHLLR